MDPDETRQDNLEVFLKFFTLIIPLETILYIHTAWQALQHEVLLAQCLILIGH